MRINKTTDYDMFKKLPGNRPILRSHFKRLVRSINKDNQLHLHPIIVNDKNEVIDGQHRLAVARELNFEIFYIKDDTVDSDHLVLCNANQKAWAVQQFIKYYAEIKKNENYIKLIQLSESLDLSIKNLITLLYGTTRLELYEFIKEGQFVMPKEEAYYQVVSRYVEFIEYCKTKHITPIKMFTGTKFLRAFYKFVNDKEVNLKQFYDNLDKRWYDLKPQFDSWAWLDLLLEIYNYNKKNKLSLSLPKSKERPQ